MWCKSRAYNFVKLLICYIRMFWKEACLSNGTGIAGKITQGVDILLYNFLRALKFIRKAISGFALSWDGFAVLQRFLRIPSQQLTCLWILICFEYYLGNAF